MIKLLLRTVAACGVLGVFSLGGASGPPKASPVLVSEFIYAKAPFPQCHASTIEETPHGLVAAWFGGTREGAKDVGIWVSRQVGGKWTVPLEVADGTGYRNERGEPVRYPCWNPVLFQPKKGPLLLFYKCGPSPRAWWALLMTSGDGGKTWSQPTRLPDGHLGPVRNRPAELPGGAILCGSSTEHDGWKVHFEVTGDLGKTWRRTEPVEASEKFGAIQPTLFLHPGGKIQALCRTKQDVVSETWSADGGKTWSKMTSTALPNPNSGIAGVTLRDGRHALVYNPTKRGGQSPRGREMLALAISRDGKEWKNVLTLENEKGAEFSYPAIIQTADGALHITYTWKRQRVKHVAVAADRLP